jgi:hypothetical protein
MSQLSLILLSSQQLTFTIKLSVKTQLHSCTRISSPTLGQASQPIHTPTTPCQSTRTIGNSPTTRSPSIKSRLMSTLSPLAKAMIPQGRAKLSMSSVVPTVMSVKSLNVSFQRRRLTLRRVRKLKVDKSSTREKMALSGNG